MIFDFVDESVDQERIAIASFSAMKADAMRIRDTLIKFYDRVWRNFIGVSYRLNEAKFSAFLMGLSKVKKHDYNRWLTVMNELKEMLVTIARRNTIRVIIANKKLIKDKIDLLINPEKLHIIEEIGRGNKKYVKLYVRELGLRRYAVPSRKTIELAKILIAICRDHDIIVDENILNSKSADQRSLNALLRVLIKRKLYVSDSQSEPGIQVADFIAGFTRNFHDEIEGWKGIKISLMELWIAQ